MIKLSLYFTIEEAVSLFRNVGLTVERRYVEREFHAPHRPIELRIIPTWIVVNPHTNKEELLEDCFRKYLSQQYKELFLQPNKLTIYNVFNKKQDEGTVG